MTNQPITPIDPGPLVMSDHELTAWDGRVLASLHNVPAWEGHAAWLVRASNEYQKWQPIETAPKDERVLAIFCKGQIISFAIRDSHNDMWCLDGGDWRGDCTHWMRPKPPVGEGGA